MYQYLFKRFLAEQNEKLFFTGHGHHFWPDVTREAMLEYWDDSARWVDDKWEHCFQKKIRLAQVKISETLNIDFPGRITFAPNTHELIYRVLTSIPATTCHILTTDSEFYSFERQALRLLEANKIKITRLNSTPAYNLTERMIEKTHKQHIDCVFLSHVFFNSGVVTKNLELLTELPSETFLIIDAYHSFFAIPTNFKLLQHRAFIVAGSYKYAGAGEGCCFLYSPPHLNLRPVYTGLSAQQTLPQTHALVDYQENGHHYAGGTLDYSALYRLTAVYQKYHQDGITVEAIHDYVQKCQKNFLKQINQLGSKILNLNALIRESVEQHGHFFTFNLPNEEICKQVHCYLKHKNIITNYRGNRLRFGFGIYLPSNFDFSVLKNLDKDIQRVKLK